MELFRFNMLRAPAPLDTEAHVALDHEDSSLQITLANQKGPNAPASARRLSQEFLETNRAAITSLVTDGFGPALLSLSDAMKGLRTATPAPSDNSIDELVRGAIQQWTQQPVDQLSTIIAPQLALVHDAIIAMRILNPTAEQLTSILGRVDLAQLLVDRARLALVVGLLQTQPLDVAKFEQAMNAKLASRHIEIVKAKGTFQPEPAPTSAQELADARLALASLEDLILRVERAAPSKLDIEANRVVLETTFRVVLIFDTAALPSQLQKVLGDPVLPQLELDGEWTGLHARLTQLARRVQLVVDKLELAVRAAAPGPAPVSANSTTTPIVAGQLRVAGMSEVKVIRSHVKTYERTELAHIENILAGENRDRQFRTLNRTEDETATETESSTTEETEVKSEDSSSIKSSVDQVLKENIDLKVGFDLKAKAGVVEIGLNTSFAFGRSKEETKRDAVEFAKDVTNRAARKVTESVHTTIKSKVIHETEEIVKHQFDNPTRPGGGNVSGMYQWIEKVYTMQMFEVGRASRAIVDGVVLQPGQRLLAAPVAVSATLASANAPPVFDISPAQIHPWNYQSLAAKHGATGLSTPPSLTTTTSISAANPQNAADDKATTMSFAQDVALGDGTAAIYGSMTLSVEISGDSDQEFAMGAIGTRTFTLTGETNADGTPARSEVDLVKDAKSKLRAMRLVSTAILGGERGLVPCTVFAGRVVGFAAAVAVTCARTPESYEAWQLACYSAMAAAHAKAKQDYDELVARNSVQQSYVPPSPAAADLTIREELKRCAIALLANPGAPESFAASLDGFYAAGQASEVALRCLFFEHALEWENMTYVVYPYFWADGRNDGWNHRSRSDQPTGELADFLRAGAARVVIPIRPLPTDAAKGAKSFQDYLEANQLPDLAALVDVDSPLRIAIEDEIQLRAGQADDEVWIEDWDVSVPTELVQLRDLDAPLPVWKEAEDATTHKLIKGTWIEIETT